LAAAPAVAVQAAKRAVRTADALWLPAALELERRKFLATLASGDARKAGRFPGQTSSGLHSSLIPEEKSHALKEPVRCN
jgi:hypothetical protein